MAAILVVDDDEEYLLYVTHLLTQDGHKPLTASTGLAARKMIAEGGFSLILTDLRLLDDSGLDLMGFARKVDPLAVCIAMTAFASKENAVEALREGAYDYLLKPSDADVIRAAVRRGLECNRLRRELMERTAQLEALKAQGHERTKDLLSELSRRLRDPLSVIFGWASYLADAQAQAASSEKVRQPLSMIRRNAEKMRQILDVAHPQN